MAEVKITKDNFDSEVLNSDIPVIIDFWATWCGPCMMLAPVLEEIANEYEGKIKVGKINVDEENELAIKYKIASIPAVFKIENGEITKKAVGYMTKEKLIKELEL